MLIICMPVRAKSLQLCLSLCIWTVAEKSTRLLSPWGSPDKNTGVGCHARLQGIFLTQGSNLHLMSAALAGWFLTTSATWETPSTV